MGQNNDMLVMVYNFNVKAKGRHELEVYSQDKSVMQKICNPANAPVSSLVTSPVYKLPPGPEKDQMCIADVQRCQRQIDLQELTLWKVKLDTGLSSGLRGN